MNTHQGGLRLLPRDDRDYQLGNVYTLPELSELPPTFNFDPISIEHQGQSDFCSGYATCGASALQEGIRLDPRWSFAVSKMITGDVDTWGQDLRSACKVHTKYGAIPYQDKEKGEDLRHIDEWSESLFEQAKGHQKKTYFAVKGHYDPFDNLRASMYLFRAEKKTPVFGLNWSWPLSQHELKGTNENGFGHALYAIGWRYDFLIIVNSYGLDAGNKGKHYVHRETINHFVDKYGAYMFTDMPQDEAKHRNEKKIPVGTCWLKEILISFINVWKR